MSQQFLLAIGTEHHCPKCGQSYVCEEDGCLLGEAMECARCNEFALMHHSYCINRCKHEPELAAKIARISARQAGRTCIGSLQIVQPEVCA